MQRPERPLYDIPRRKFFYGLLAGGAELTFGLGLLAGNGPSTLRNFFLSAIVSNNNIS